MMHRRDYWDVVFNEWLSDWFLSSKWALVAVVLTALLFIGLGISEFFSQLPTHPTRRELLDYQDRYLDGWIKVGIGVALVPVTLLVRWFHNR